MPLRLARSSRVLAMAVAAIGGPAALAVPASAAARRSLHRAPRSLTLNWVGDISFSTQRGLPAGGPVTALASVDRSLRSANLVMGNLEGQLSSGGPSKCGSGAGGGNCFAFQAPPAFARGLRGAGFDLMNLANNHALDFGPAGQAQTITALSSAGIAHAGLPGEITLRRVHGLRVAVLGFAPYPWASPLLDLRAAGAQVRRARRRADVVMVVIHAGAEGANQAHTPHGEEFAFGENRGHARAFAHAAINAGASIVVGSGPHVLRGIERYRRRLIAYSLGNFAGPNTLGLGGVLSLTAILHVRLAAGGRVLGGRLIPLVLEPPGLPHPDSSGAAVGLVRTLSREDFGARRFPLVGRGTIRPG